MEIQYYGGNCVALVTKKIRVVIDDNLAALGQKSIVTDKDISLITNTALINDAPSSYFEINSPGEFEVSDISIQGIAARAHIDEEKTNNATMYRVIIGDVRVGIVGHIHPDLTEAQLEELGTIDILVVPVGGSGYTLDGIGAHKVIRKIEPKVIIPTHYNDAKLKYEVPQSDLDEALKAVGMEAGEHLDSLKLKGSDFDEAAKLVVLERK